MSAIKANTSILTLTAGTAVSAFALYHLLDFLLRPLLSPLRNIRGPPNPSLLWGHLKLIREADTAVLHEEWEKEFGHTFVYKGPFLADRLHSSDHKALAHVLNRTDIYQKPKRNQQMLTRLLGEGVLVAEGETHKRQRRVLNPAFSMAQIRSLTGIFLSKTNELRDTLIAQLDRSEKGTTTIDFTPWLSKATLDIIGLAGFNYRFNALTATPENPNELMEAFSAVMKNGFQMNLIAFLTFMIPYGHLIPTKNRGFMKKNMGVMNRIGSQLLAEKKQALLSSAKGSHIDKESMSDRDILSVLVRANMATDIPESLRLSDEEVLAQIPTFLLAGHETTATSTLWALHSLSLDVDFQDRLRAELLAFHLPTGHAEEPLSAETLSALNSLPLLDATVRETLRNWAPVANTVRVAGQDDVIPISTPFKDKSGVLRDSIHVKKGDNVIIPILSINRSTKLWGDDAHEWKPDRWLSGVPAAASTVPNVFANLMTFLSGPHACIGYRFSIIEMKILLHALITTFSFTPGSNEIIRKTGLVTRPYVKSEIEKGSQLPLVVRRIEHAG